MASLAKPEKRVERTPGPWAVKGPKGPVGRDKEGDRLICNEETREHVAEVFQYRNHCHKDEVTSIANAAYIVRACNAHDSLVGALQGLLSWPALIGCADTRVAKARAALALANVDPDDPATLARTADAVIESGVLEEGGAS